MNDLAMWPDRLVERFHQGAPDKRQVFEKFVSDGLVVHTDFSGRLGPEVAVRMLQQSWAEAGVSMPLYFWSGCDILQVSHTIMLQDTVGHVFNGLLSKMPAAHQDEIKARRPAEGSDLATRRVAYEGMKSYLSENILQCFPLGATGFCLKHRRQCPVSWPGDLESLKSLPGGGTGGSSSVAVDDADGPCVGVDPLKLGMAGPMCTPWCNSGHHEGLSDPATEPWHLFSHAMEAEQYDAILIENSPLFPEDIWTERVGDTHSTVSIRLSPAKHVMCALRDRVCSHMCLVSNLQPHRIPNPMCIGIVISGYPIQLEV